MFDGNPNFPFGIPNNHSNGTFYLFINKIVIETESLMTFTFRMVCCNIWKDHREDSMIVLGSTFSSVVQSTAFDFDNRNKSKQAPQLSFCMNLMPNHNLNSV